MHIFFDVISEAKLTIVPSIKLVILAKAGIPLINRGFCRKAGFPPSRE
jgi:hypothetical protein